MFCSTFTAWNCVAFQGKSVSGSEVTPTTRVPPLPPAALGLGAWAEVDEQPVSAVDAAVATPIARSAPRVNRDVCHIWSLSDIRCCAAGALSCAITPRKHLWLSWA